MLPPNPDPPAHYAACYCEENVWHLCQEPRFAAWPREVLLISNLQRSCALWHQRAAAAPGEPVIWDYHVVLVLRRAPPEVWDVDSTLPWPVPLAHYLDRSFPHPRATPVALRPSFRVLAAEEYVSTLASDRSHMRRPDGRWSAPPPLWPLIGSGAPNLMTWVDMARPTPGRVLDLPGLRRRYQP